MARINLLPWREWLREKRRKRYIGMLVALLVVTAAGLYVLDHFVDRAVERQLARNDLIRSAMVQLDGRAQQIDPIASDSPGYHEADPRFGTITR